MQWLRYYRRVEEHCLPDDGQAVALSFLALTAVTISTQPVSLPLRTAR